MDLRTLFNISAGKRQLLAEQRPLVLMGRGHSGTRVLAYICHELGIRLWSDQNRQSGDTDRAFNRRLKKMVAKNLECNTKNRLRPSDQRRFARAVYGYYLRLGQPGGMWGWKFPETYLLAPYVEDIFPKAIYLHMVRDGRDVAFKRHLTDDPKRRAGRALLHHLNALHLPRHLQAALSWQFQVESFAVFSSRIPESRMHFLRFEDLLAQPQQQTMALCKFLGVQMTDSCQHYIETQINKSKIAQFVENESVQIAAIEQRIGSTLSHYGYKSI